MRDHQAYILLLGVGLERCTAIHHAEEVMAPDLYVRPMEAAERYDLVDRGGAVHSVLSRRHPKLPRDFGKFLPGLRRCGGVVEGESWLMLSASRLYGLVFAALAERREATLSDAAIS
jgi:aminoglycoside 3-N-acetyltransferase